MEITRLDGRTFRHILCGGANGIRLHIDEINDLNVFPVPDGDTGTNMTKTIESGVVKMMENEARTLSEVAKEFAKGSLFGARGNSGVILSQFFAGICEGLAEKETASAEELSMAYLQGVKRSYSAVVTPVEGTILTVVRESAEYAKSRIKEDSTIEEFLKLNIEEAERSLARTKELLPVLTEADVVDSGGAGYLYIAKGMYAALCNESEDRIPTTEVKTTPGVNYDLFTTDSVLTFGYCTECMVRLQREKLLHEELDVKSFTEQLEAMDCDSIVAIRDGDLLKVHAHTMTPSDVLTLCQKYGEFLNVKIENMSLQHSEKEDAPKTLKKKKTPHKRYGVVTVATGEGMRALFTSLGADVIIDGGQTGNPSAEQFLAAFEELNADAIFVFPNNGNILLTAQQAAELWEGAPVTVIPTKTLPQGYAALAVFNPSVSAPEDQVADLIAAKDAVVSGELTVAVRDTVIGGVSVKEGEYIGILDGELLTSDSDPVRALGDMIEKIDDLSERELITLFVGESVSERERVTMTEALEERFEDHVIEVYLGGQKIYDYLIAVE